MSQDLLDKQIELLERKYGGSRARYAAITIQRAFRHYMMVKKFASITAMAKAEKRMSRRLPMQSQQPANNNPGPPDYTDDAMGVSYVSNISVSAGSDTDVSMNSSNQSRSACGMVATGTPTNSRVAPIRSMSLRERRSMDASPIPRSQSGNSSPMQAATAAAWSKSNQHSHPVRSILHFLLFECVTITTKEHTQFAITIFLLYFF